MNGNCCHLNWKINSLAIGLTLLIYLPLPVSAHPGRLNKDGGHRDAATGAYHYHKGPRAETDPPPRQYEEVKVFVARVVDGDTFLARFPHGKVERVRIEHINAPEADQPGGAEATEELRIRIEGKELLLRIRAGEAYPRDKFGRILAEIQ